MARCDRRVLTSYVEEMPTGGAEDDEEAAADELDLSGIFSLHLDRL
jgi:hypothetical protein